MPGGSAAICITGSTASRSPFHRCASAAEDVPAPGAATSSRSTAGTWARPDSPGVARPRCRPSSARDWPGNVRELEAVIERAVITSRGAALRISDARPPGEPVMPGSVRVTAAEGTSGDTVPGTEKTLTDFERDHILATLEKTYWRLEGENGAAAILGMNPSTLRSRMRKHGLRRPPTRTAD